MVQVRQRVLAAVVGLALLVPLAAAPRFFPDDPLWNEPAPLPVPPPRKRSINEYYDFFQNTFFTPGKELRKRGAVPPAGAVNTLGEVPDGPWYWNRDPRAMSIDDLVRGPGNSNPPSIDGPWTVISGKSEGITPGLMISDARGTKYLLKFDPKQYPELASAADVIGSKFFYALGYHVPENYIVRFTRAQLKVSKEARFTDHRGKERGMREGDVDDVLMKVPEEPKGQYRALASMILAGEPIGAFRFHGVRSDDPNDVVPHEHRRDLRGLSVFAAWLNHTDSKALNTLDTVIEEKGLRYIRHHLIDFGAILGSDSFTAKSPRAGFVYLFEWKAAAAQFFSLGLYTPEWMHADYPRIRGVGHLESEIFDPEAWRSNYPNPAFRNCLPDDAFWAARKVMAFSDEQIRAVVATGQYSDPAAVDYITRQLIVRRDKIGRTFFSRVLPLDSFVARNGRLEFEDLAVKYNFTAARKLQVRWSRLENGSGRTTPAPGDTFALPALLRSPGQYAAAEIRGDDPSLTTTVYLRNQGGRVQVVGIERRW
ncbi:MAG TPA: hypothetical protein VN442_11725 [Bryobacteraceae bacterium]|nr:hypothetical protein [Bryobacteraceae bacterium]